MDKNEDGERKKTVDDHGGTEDHKGMPPHLLAKHKMNFLYHSAVVLVLCEKRQPLQSGNLSESCREDVSLTLRKICYLLWMTKDAFRVQTIGSRELVSSLAGLDWEGDLQ